MKLYPQDLRESWHGEIIALRANGVTPEMQSVFTSDAASARQVSALLVRQPPARKPIGRLGRRWLGKLSLTRPQAEMALSASAASTQGIAWVSQILLTALGGLAGALLHKNGVTPEALATVAPASVALAGAGLASVASLYPSFVAWPRAALRSLYQRPITATEIELLTPRAQTDLERDYLTLLREAVSHPVPPAAEEDVRAALQSLGQAVGALPATEPEPVDTRALREEAAALRARAGEEADPIIADAQENRADALLRRADAADRSAQYARRIHALREEVAAQIAAVRQDLTAFRAEGVGAAVSGASHAHLADTGRRIGTVADSIARARAELDGALADPVSADAPQYPKAAEEPDAQTVRLTIQ